MLAVYSDIAPRGVIDAILTRDLLGLFGLLKYTLNKKSN